MTEPTKRKKFSEAEDVMLLKQTIADHPYRQEHGKVMEQWEKLAEALVASPSFTRKNPTVTNCSKSHQHAYHPSRTSNFAKLAEIFKAKNEQELTMRREQWERARDDRRAHEKRFMLMLEHLANIQQ
ncbi:hypothetical protein GN244_ATG06042 [Phytophthora infestans]|uniref:Myb-like domain-containing protein n=1 Tax=Phytophthora infestans TaxID=4787 RepID=A0A833T3F9_PHYIN|nr:hypothetical protein GN244_ATG06042 [Phytophthora infestans]